MNQCANTRPESHAKRFKPQGPDLHHPSTQLLGTSPPFAGLQSWPWSREIGPATTDLGSRLGLPPRRQGEVRARQLSFRSRSHKGLHSTSQRCRQTLGLERRTTDHRFHRIAVDIMPNLSFRAGSAAHGTLWTYFLPAVHDPVPTFHAR